MSDIKYEAELKLQEALTECQRLRDENSHLRQLLGMPLQFTEINSEVFISAGDKENIVTNRSSVEVKLSLFKSLFRGREDVFAQRWESKHGKSGYSPACVNRWKPCQCKPVKPKCQICNSRELLPLTDKALHDHLAGKSVVGIYPLLQDETCWFLAIDFDKENWHQDVKWFLQICKKFNVPAVLERSQSGNGAHVWIFFNHPISAFVARKLVVAY